jgi:hypothetical protein
MKGSIPTARWRSCKFRRKKKRRFAALFAEPSDGLEPSTPSLPWSAACNWSQPTATFFAHLSRFRRRRICHRLPSVATAGLHKGSILRCPRWLRRGAVRRKLLSPGPRHWVKSGLLRDPPAQCLIVTVNASQWRVAAVPVVHARPAVGGKMTPLGAYDGETVSAAPAGDAAGTETSWIAADQVLWWQPNLMLVPPGPDVAAASRTWGRQRPA